MTICKTLCRAKAQCEMSSCQEGVPVMCSNSLQPAGRSGEGVRLEVLLFTASFFLSHRSQAMMPLEGCCDRAIE